MVEICYVEHDGTRHKVKARTGLSLMDVAIMHHIPGVEGDCGGFGACGTCHVYLDEAAQSLVPPLHELESSTLTFAHDVRPESRLACQIPITDEMDGMTVQMPERQY
ncbi:2Fe-2S iron-sulfur cluster-binding protein [Parasphingorhabdus sp.]|uniref:2Fe-2S iron-sulfur cluster-binding protein n=1 Tax=Parasphingorhabdus sp. TaxID=2709688 RepID=UPI003D28E008